MPVDDTVSEAQAWDMASTNSTIVDTHSEPPRFSSKVAAKIMTRAYSGLEPEESVASPNNSSSADSRKKPSSSGSCRKARRSDEAPQASSRASSRFGDSGSISGRSQMSALERHLQGGCSVASSTRKSKSTKKSSRPEPAGTLALVTRKASVDPPSVAGSVKYFEDSNGALVPVNLNGDSYDPPAGRMSQLSTCEEADEDATRRSSTICATETLSDSYNSRASGSHGTTPSSDTGESGTIEDTTDSLVASIEENALVIRGVDDISVPTETQSRTLMATTDTNNGALVPAAPRYLASAVDNQAAMVPFDSTLFESYDHTFVKCPEAIRFHFLYTFLKKNADKKIIVYFSTTQSAKYHSKLLEHFHIPTLCMHNKQKKQTFINTFFKFSDLSEGILCATDIEGRDLDIPPSVDWVVQFEPPDDPTEYIMRVSRISCDSDRVGRSLLFLNPGEQGFLKYYHSAAIPVSEFEIPKLADIQGQIEYHVTRSESFSRYAKEAYGSYLIAYASHSFRDVYNVHDLNKNDVAAAFGLVQLPEIESDDETSVASGEGKRESQAAGQAPVEGSSRKTWRSNTKAKEKSWLKTEKSWPHCKIKVHPKFKPGYVPKEGDYVE
jgi:hypothetical protein